MPDTGTMFRGSFAADPARAAEIMALDEREAIRDRGLLIKCGLVLAGVFAGFLGHALFHIGPSIVALIGAGILVLISGVPRRDYLSAVEWDYARCFLQLPIGYASCEHCQKVSTCGNTFCS